MKHLLVEGWRGISQSFAMVNQYQLYELTKRPDFVLCHRDLPFDRPSWNPVENNPGFPRWMNDPVMAIPPPDRDEFDCVYNIASPFRKSGTRAAKIVTFMTGEFGLRPDSFVGGDTDIEFFCRGANEVVVPSRWSKMKLIEFGFPETKVAIVPHGVSASLYSPLSAAERETARRQLNIPTDSFVFLNLGAMTWNKGIDVLVRAFAETHKQHASARLVLKDDRKLYDISASAVIQKALQGTPEALDETLRASIILISDTLSLGQMRLLYGTADAYVSPYRAEGFNLPVIEAMACGTTAIVTAGGPTDDFCGPHTSRKIASAQVECASRGIPGSGYFLEPNFEDLVRCMDETLRTPQDPRVFEDGRKKLMERYSWTSCVRQLEHLI